MADQDTKTEEWVYSGPETMTLQLLKPISLGTNDPVTVTALELKEPEAGQISAFLQEQRKSDDMRATCLLISLVSGVTIHQALKMGTRDILRASDFLTGFSPPTPKTTFGAS